MQSHMKLSKFSFIKGLGAAGVTPGSVDMITTALPFLFDILAHADRPNKEQMIWLLSSVAPLKEWQMTKSGDGFIACYVAVSQLFGIHNIHNLTDIDLISSQYKHTNVVLLEHFKKLFKANPIHTSRNVIDSYGLNNWATLFENIKSNNFKKPIDILHEEELAKKSTKIF